MTTKITRDVENASCDYQTGDNSYFKVRKVATFANIKVFAVTPPLRPISRRNVGK